MRAIVHLDVIEIDFVDPVNDLVAQQVVVRKFLYRLVRSGDFLDGVQKPGRHVYQRLRAAIAEVLKTQFRKFLRVAAFDGEDLRREMQVRVPFVGVFQNLLNAIKHRKHISDMAIERQGVRAIKSLEGGGSFARQVFQPFLRRFCRRRGGGVDLVPVKRCQARHWISDNHKTLCEVQRLIFRAGGRRNRPSPAVRMNRQGVRIHLSGIEVVENVLEEGAATLSDPADGQARRVFV